MHEPSSSARSELNEQRSEQSLRILSRPAGRERRRPLNAPTAPLRCVVRPTKTISFQFFGDPPCTPVARRKKEGNGFVGRVRFAYILTRFSIFRDRLYTKFVKNSIYSKKYKNVVQNLQKTRHESGLTQVEVAKKLSKPQSYVSKVERGERRLDVIELEMFAKLYKKDVTFFLK